MAPSPGHVGFLTITTPDVTDNEELRKRWRSFTTNFLKPHPDFGEWVNTKEVQKRGAWHFHLVIVLSQDIREGINFDQLKEGNYSSASPFLRRIWKELREALPLYGFGRSELLPVKSNADGIARYIGKYISKHIGSRAEEHKGVRLISYSTGWERNSIRFAWNTRNAREWRRKVEIFAKYHGCQEFYQFSAKLGPNWAYKYLQEIIDIDSRENEREFNKAHGNHVDPLPEYIDRTVKEQPHNKIRNDQYARKAIEKLSRYKEVVNWEKKEQRKAKRKSEAQRNIHIAKSGCKAWVENLHGREIKKTPESNAGYVAPIVELVGGQLVIATGRKAGEILF